jgi:2-haloacid dehalogenase
VTGAGRAPGTGAAPGSPRAVVLDVGNVLVEWDPRHLYRQLLRDEEQVEHFLTTVCTPEWNRAQDAGRPWVEAVAALTAVHPEHAALIAAFDRRWEEMVPGEVEGSVAVLEALRASGVPVFGLTNFSVEKWELTRRRFPFLDRFDDVVVSGREGVVKPDPAIFTRALARFGLEAAETAFVDDSAANVAAARDLGMTALPFTDASALRADLARLGLLDG